MSLEGDTTYGGASATIPIPETPISATGGMNVGRTSDGYWGVTKTTGIATPGMSAEVHGGYAQTTALTEQFNIIDWFIALFS